MRCPHCGEEIKIPTIDFNGVYPMYADEHGTPISATPGFATPINLPRYIKIVEEDTEAD